MEYLDLNYADRLDADDFPQLISLSKVASPILDDTSYPITTDHSLEKKLMARLPAQLFIADKEKYEADLWLHSKGLEPNDQLCIMIDSSAVASKLLPDSVYFRLLKELLKSDENIKILVFDENSGKQK